ncbi:hypothetical protein Nepgr_025747 [Nepenthes gracilis]|uniref:Uncharacterized protein n=1 Tax=Nepenthes gracilis TaxID=150966 RepID=A0AAD3T6Z5_NEPGR|nr:hypothetical protein Nepgr_025747 [Nepenthes gracilis]
MTRLADDANGWMVMLDYRTPKSPSKRNLKLLTLSLAKTIAPEWEYQNRLPGIEPVMKDMGMVTADAVSLFEGTLTYMPLSPSLMTDFSSKMKEDNDKVSDSGDLTVTAMPLNWRSCAPEVLRGSDGFIHFKEYLPMLAAIPVRIWELSL